MDKPGEYRNDERARQLLRFSGMQYGTITPTDIDSLIEYHDKAYVIIEVKKNGAPVPAGQRKALTRFINAVGDAGKLSVAIVAEHGILNPHCDVLLKACQVREVYFSQERKWRAPKRQMTVDGCVREFLRAVDGVAGNSS